MNIYIQIEKKNKSIIANTRGASTLLDNIKEKEKKSEIINHALRNDNNVEEKREEQRKERKYKTYESFFHPIQSDPI